MYVREAKNREEVWLLDHIEEFGLDDTAFRSRDYVVAVDETTGDKAGFGRIRIHPSEDEVCELTSIGVLPEWRDQGVGAHVIERLLDHAADAGFDRVYAITDEIEYLRQFGFTPIEQSALPSVLADRLEVKQENMPDALGLVINIDSFEMPQRLRERFKDATPLQRDSDQSEDDGDLQSEIAEDFGIDPDDVTHKYEIDR